MERLLPPLAELPGGDRRIDGIPRPDWERIDEAVGALPQEQQLAAWGSLCEEWAGAIAATLGPGHRVRPSEHFVLVTSGDDRYAELALERCEAFRLGLVSALPGIAFEGHLGPLLLYAGPQADYYRFISSFYPDGDHPGSVGLFFSGDGWDILSWTLDALTQNERVIAHELTHAALASLETLPIWLNEGLATTYERRLIDPKSRLVLDPAERGRVGALFRTATVADFLSGQLFHVPGPFNDAAYLVAEALVAQLEPLEGFGDFLTGADAADGGGAAAAELLHIALPGQVEALVKALSAGGIEPPSIDDDEQPDLADFDAPPEPAPPSGPAYRGLVVVGAVVLGFMLLRGCS